MHDCSFDTRKKILNENAQRKFCQECSNLPIAVPRDGWVVDGFGCWNTPSRQVVGQLSNPSWIGRKETKVFE
jgi:hypothetical protein